MKHQRIKTFREFRMKKKYEVLLISFFILIFGDILSPQNYDIMPILLIQNVVASLVLFYGKKKWRFPLKFLLFIIVSVEIISLLLQTDILRPIIGIIYVIYFFFLSIELYSQILRTKEISLEMVSAVLCGFIILGLIGSYIFFFIEVLHTGSFANLSGGMRRFPDLAYFSFISILGIGYGDIYPVTALAKKVTLLIGILGHFYNVIVIGIVIGKYIAIGKSKKSLE
jgi:hypothetical protein